MHFSKLSIILLAGLAMAAPMQQKRQTALDLNLDIGGIVDSVLDGVSGTLDDLSDSLTDTLDGLSLSSDDGDDVDDSLGGIDDTLGGILG